MNEDEIKKIILDSYLKILKREADIDGLNYYLDLMKKGEINQEKLENILTNSDEFIGYKQIEKSLSKKLKNYDQIKIPKIVAMYRIRNEARWIEKSLEQTSKICQEIVILDDCSTDNTVEICKKFSNVVEIHERKEQLPLDEVRDRNIVLELALKLNPDYILIIDGDEVLMNNSKEILYEELSVLYPEAKIVYLQILDVWDKSNQIRIDGLYGKTWRPSLLKIDKTLPPLKFIPTKYPGNLHCGSIPSNTIGIDNSIRSNAKIIHCASLDESIRSQKYQWYVNKDPDSPLTDNYQHMIGARGHFSGDILKFKSIPLFLS